MVNETIFCFFLYISHHHSAKSKFKADVPFASWYIVRVLGHGFSLENQTKQNQWQFFSCLRFTCLRFLLSHVEYEFSQLHMDRVIGAHPTTSLLIRAGSPYIPDCHVQLSFTMTSNHSHVGRKTSGKSPYFGHHWLSAPANTWWLAQWVEAYLYPKNLKPLAILASVFLTYRSVIFKCLATSILPDFSSGEDEILPSSLVFRKPLP